MPRLGPRRDPRGAARDPDWTAGLLLGKDAAGGLYVLDLRRLRGSPQQVQQVILSTAHADGRGVEIAMEQEPGSSGKIVCDHYLRLLAGYNFHGQRSTGSKTDRALPLAAQAEGGTVKLLRGGWNKDWLDEIETFPFAGHDDAVDATTLAFTRLAWRSAGRGAGPIYLTPGYRSPYSDPPQQLGALGYGREGDGEGPLTPGYGSNDVPRDWFHPPPQ